MNESFCHFKIKNQILGHFQSLQEPRPHGSLLIPFLILLALLHSLTLQFSSLWWQLGSESAPTLPAPPVMSCGTGLLRVWKEVWQHWKKEIYTYVGFDFMSDNVTPPLYTLVQFISARANGGQLVAQSLDWDQWQYVGGPVGCTEPGTHCMFMMCVCVFAATLEYRNGLGGEPFYFRGFQGNQSIAKRSILWSFQVTLFSYVGIFTFTSKTVNWNQNFVILNRSKNHSPDLSFEPHVQACLEVNKTELQISLQDFRHEKRRKVSHSFSFFLFSIPSPAVLVLTVCGWLYGPVWGLFSWFTLQQQQLGWINWKLLYCLRLEPANWWFNPFNKVVWCFRLDLQQSAVTAVEVLFQFFLLSRKKPFPFS